MLHTLQDGSIGVRQVEVNAIASSMSGHSNQLAKMHQYLMSKYRINPPIGSYFPENQSLGLVARGIAEAFHAYDKPMSYVLLIGEERSLNFSDHLHIELALYMARPDTRIVRKRFVDLKALVSLGPNKELMLEASKEIAVVYYRYAYDPTNYNFEGSWELRLLLERSRAIKCPSINFHLSGAKKFQQVLNSPEQLEKYLDKKDAEALAQTFCKFWSLDSDETRPLVMSQADKLVLKPQREGGGHNLFGSQIISFLESITDPSVQSQFILMELINSPEQRNWLLLPDDTDDQNRLKSSDNLVSELGIFGSVLANGRQVLSNHSAGYLVRSKKHGVNEGGVATGYAGISNVLLLDDSRDDYKKFYEW